LIQSTLTALPSARSQAVPSPTSPHSRTHTAPHCIVLAKEQDEQDESVMTMALFAIATIKGIEERITHSLKSIQFNTIFTA
jgi:hypothetical protein